jgi:hypothetical protein
VTAFTYRTITNTSLAAKSYVSFPRGVVMLSPDSRLRQPAGRAEASSGVFAEMDEAAAIRLVTGVTGVATRTPRQDRAKAAE